jgi:ubiquinone/menaquinone biosynthesis C-methylase UbiE
MTLVQSAVTDFFEADAANWDAYYERHDVFSVIHQLRRSLALAWVDDLGLPEGAAVLDIGCGTGHLAVALARRGFRVTAVDTAEQMLTRARVNLATAGLGESVTLVRAGAANLPVVADTFELVTALGLLPWVPSPTDVLAEMVRALAPGGHLIATCDNRDRLTVLLDPRYSPTLAGVRSVARRLRRRRPPALTAAEATRHSAAQFRGLVDATSASIVRTKTFGFGPFTLMGHEVLPARASVAVNRGLQCLADRGVPGVRSTGTQCLVLAAKP